ncbi:MAG: hypothetical protein JO170_26065 [Verrucomicrobia bacterium]|nr:hypothetical protein [Verrucomicrobiota bacterium]
MSYGLTAWLTENNSEGLSIGVRSLNFTCLQERAQVRRSAVACSAICYVVAMMTSNEEHRKVLEKLTLPELRIVLNAFDYLSWGPRQNFRLIKRLCEERFGAEA